MLRTEKLLWIPATREIIFWSFLAPELSKIPDSMDQKLLSCEMLFTHKADMRFYLKCLMWHKG